MGSQQNISENIGTIDNKFTRGPRSGWLDAMEQSSPPAYITRPIEFATLAYYKLKQGIESLSNIARKYRPK